MCRRRDRPGTAPARCRSRRVGRARAGSVACCRVVPEVAFLLADRARRVQLLGEIRPTSAPDPTLPVEDGECRLDDGPDPEREEHGPDADGAAQQETGRQGGQLDRGSRPPDRPAEAVVEPRHEAVARPGPQVRRQVEAGRDADQEDAGARHRQLGDRFDRPRQQRQRDVGRRPDHGHVEDRADPRPLAQRPPEEQDRDPDQDADRPQLQAHTTPDPLVEHLPRAKAQPGVRHDGDAQAEQQQAREEAGQASGDAPPEPSIAHHSRDGSRARGILAPSVGQPSARRRLGDGGGPAGASPASGRAP